jgi:hypothetical protein
MKHRLAMQRAIKAELGEDSTPSMQFRLDDDDAVGLSFTRSLRWFEKHTRTMRKNWRFMAIDYNRGYSVCLSDQGILAEEVQTAFWPCGLAVLCRPGDELTVMNFGHHKLHHDMPTMIQPGPCMYLRARHDDNDSAAKFKTGPMHPLDARERSFFKSQFNVDEDQVRAVFSNPPSPVG